MKFLNFSGCHPIPAPIAGIPSFSG
jgi:hypothetical protein